MERFTLVKKHHVPRTRRKTTQTKTVANVTTASPPPAGLRAGVHSIDEADPTRPHPRSDPDPYLGFARARARRSARAHVGEELILCVHACAHELMTSLIRSRLQPAGRPRPASQRGANRVWCSIDLCYLSPSAPSQPEPRVPRPRTSHHVRQVGDAADTLADSAAAGAAHRRNDRRDDCVLNGLALRCRVAGAGPRDVTSFLSNLSVRAMSRKGSAPKRAFRRGRGAAARRGGGGPGGGACRPRERPPRPAATPWLPPQRLHHHPPRPLTPLSRHLLPTSAPSPPRPSPPSLAFLGRARAPKPASAKAPRCAAGNAAAGSPNGLGYISRVGA